MQYIGEIEIPMARDYFLSVTIGSGGWMDFSFQEKTKTGGDIKRLYFSRC